MATMQHVIKLNGIITDVISPTHNGMLVAFFGRSMRLIIDEPGKGRLIDRSPATGKMRSTKVQF